MINKILIVDDSTVLLEDLTEIVKSAGFQVSIANSGEKALEVAQQESPDLILLDIVMPDMDGYEACRELQKNDITKNIPVVFVTSKNQKADKAWAMMQGGKGFITKPYTPEQILEQIEALS